MSVQRNYDFLTLHCEYYSVFYLSEKVSAFLYQLSRLLKLHQYTTMADINEGQIDEFINRIDRIQINIQQHREISVFLL